MSCTALIIAACYTVLLSISNSVVRVIAEEAEDNIISKLENKVPGFGSPIPTIGSNVEGKSVFTNFANFNDDGQFFLKLTGLIQFEKSDAKPFVWSVLFWCGDLTFTGVPDEVSAATTTYGNGINDEGIGYVGHCVRGFLSDITNGGESGSQQSQVMINSKQKGAFTDTTSVAALYIPQTNVFEGTIHKNTDNHVFRFWDSGLSNSKIQFQGWEVHDEGLDTSTGSWSAVGDFEIISPIQASELLTIQKFDFTKDEFQNLYSKLHSINNNDDDNDENDSTTSTTNSKKQSTLSSAAFSTYCGIYRKLSTFVTISILVVLLLFGI